VTNFELEAGVIRIDLPVGAITRTGANSKKIPRANHRFRFMEYPPSLWFGNIKPSKSNIISLVCFTRVKDERGKSLLSRKE
jgi:hypothetical protein